MALSAGTRLGPYEILSPLGAGGMGEVYRARDTKLDRDVAIKVLPESVAADPDALARFEREAKAVAALSHPNILAIFDFGTHDGHRPTPSRSFWRARRCADKLDAGPIPQKQAVDYALQIAKGLSAAHEKGIVHRDLKPENLFVTKDGHVKILDFGLAKRVEAVAPSEETSAPTGSGHTEPGTVMGTMGYMSPEQVRGLPVDHRSDIFSFGAILYEMLSGKKAFKRDTASDTMAAILSDEPPELTQSGRNISPALDHIVKHCLEKDRDNRFQSARDIAFALSEQSSPTVASGAAARRAAGCKEEGSSSPLRPSSFWPVAGVFLLRRPHEGSGRGRRRQARGRAAVREPGRSRRRLLRRRHRGRDTRQADVPAGRRGDRPRQLDAVQEDDQDAEADRRGAGSELPADGHGALGEDRRHEPRPGQPGARRGDESGAATSKWQQPFDAALTDVFQVQSDIATKVAQALGVALGAGEEKRLSEKPTQNLAAYDAFLKGEEIRIAAINDPAQPAQGARLLRAGRGARSRLRAGVGGDLHGQFVLYATARRRPSWRSAPGRRRRRPSRSHRTARRDTWRSASTSAWSSRDLTRALEQYEKGRRLAPGDADLLRATALAEQGLGRWDAAVEHLRQAERLDPRSVNNLWTLGARSFACGAIPRRERPSTVVSPSRPRTSP